MNLYRITVRSQDGKVSALQTTAASLLLAVEGHEQLDVDRNATTPVTNLVH
jgi:hypothetical protein